MNIVAKCCPTFTESYRVDLTLRSRQSYFQDARGFVHVVIEWAHGCSFIHMLIMGVRIAFGLSYCIKYMMQTSLFVSTLVKAKSTANTCHVMSFLNIEKIQLFLIFVPIPRFYSRPESDFKCVRSKGMCSVESHRLQKVSLFVWERLCYLVIGSNKRRNTHIILCYNSAAAKPLYTVNVCNSCIK